MPSVNAIHTSNPEPAPSPVPSPPPVDHPAPPVVTSPIPGYSPSYKCFVCGVGPPHKIDAYQQFLSLSPTQRAEKVNKDRRCLRCITGHHLASQCRSTSNIPSTDLPVVIIVFCTARHELTTPILIRMPLKRPTRLMMTCHLLRQHPASRSTPSSRSAGRPPETSSIRLIVC